MPIFKGTINSNWGTAGNWDTGVLPISTGAGTDAIFDATSPNCTVNVTGECRNLNFTGYTGTITMNSNINVGSQNTGNLNHSVTLSPTMTIAGTGTLVTRANGTTTLTSNGKVWGNNLNINTAQVVFGSTAVIVGDWTVNNLTIAPAATTVLTFNGAQTITVNGNFTNLLTGTTSRIIATSGAITTIKLAGTGTWSQPNSGTIGFGLNLTIDTAGTITIADGCVYGGQGTAPGSTFKYIAGTVITQGTFYLINSGSFYQNYTVDVAGSNSTSATTTSTSGVNFNNLVLYTNSSLNSTTAIISGNICVVGNFSVTSVSTTKGFITLNGGSFFLNGNVTVNGYTTVSGTTPTFTLQGSGTKTWSENNTLTSGSSAFGLNGNLVVNVSGTVSLSSYVGVRGGTFTYTNGTFNFNTFGFRFNAMTLSGLSSMGTIPYIMHTTTSTGTNAGASLTINDSAVLNISTLTFDGFTNGGLGHYHGGTRGWTVGTFTYQQSAAVISGDSQLRLQTGNTYRVTTTFTFLGRSRSQANGTGSTMTGNGGVVTFIVDQGANQAVWVMGAVNVDSSAGQTIWDRWGTLSNATNWRSYVAPRTVHQPFISG